MTFMLVFSGVLAGLYWWAERGVRRHHKRRDLWGDPILGGSLAMLPGAILVTLIFVMLLVVYIVRWITDGVPPR